MLASADTHSHTKMCSSGEIAREREKAKLQRSRSPVCGKLICNLPTQWLAGWVSEVSLSLSSFHCADFFVAVSSSFLQNCPVYWSSSVMEGGRDRERALQCHCSAAAAEGVSGRP